MPVKILFILKYREAPGPQPYSQGGMSSGLYNSANMVKTALNEFGLKDMQCEAKLVQVQDNNCIDREVALFKPDIVIIEAIWVVPEKFTILQRLHPTVKWIIRNHSNIPFLSGEGSAIGWISEYIKHKNVYVATNTKESLDDLKLLASIQLCDNWKIIYFPNYYMSDVEPFEYTFDSNILNVGCFGAIRPLKNQLQQAFSAIKYAKSHNKYLNFHINASRIEGNAASTMKNLKSLFNNADGVSLIEHGWMSHDKFIGLIGTMDLSMQVSLSETFNIVTADAVMMDVPVVVSHEIKWVDDRYKAITTDTIDIINKMHLALNDSNQHNNVDGLEEYNKNSYRSITSTLTYMLNLI